MSFSSLLFVCCFFALSLLSQLFLKAPKAKNIAMLVFSVAFYCWNGPRYLFLLVGMTLVTWFFGLLIGSSQDVGKRKVYLLIALSVLVAGTVFFRHRGFLAEILHMIRGTSDVISEVAAPIGIAFYSLQMISYLVDVYRGEVRAQSKIWLLLTYFSLFQLSMGGPVVRYQEIRKDLLRRRTIRSMVNSGISRFTIGLAKRAILAESLFALASALLPVKSELLTMQPSLALWIGLAVYGLGVYFEFSAYADMAIGMGRLFGLRFPENFDDPFRASSLTEFWSKCQMTVVAFFRDYVSNPLGKGDGPAWKKILSMFGVWLLIGLWMGAGWNYILLAVYFFLLIALEQFVLREKLDKLPGWLRHIGTVAAVWLSTILLWCEDIGMLPAFFKSLIGIGGGIVSGPAVMMILNQLPIILLAVAGVMGLGKSIRGVIREKSENSSVFQVLDALWEALHPVVLLVLSAMALAGNTANPFLFIQF